MKKIYVWLIGIAALCIVIGGISLAAPTRNRGEAETPAAVTPLMKNQKLYVQEGQVRNTFGEPFVLRGVSVTNLSWMSQYVNQEAFQTVRDLWNVNTIRLPMPTDADGSFSSPAARTELLEVLDRGIEAATELGMYVIADWHVLYEGDPLLHVEEAKEFFSYVAEKYGEQDNILYEICSDPSGETGTWDAVKEYAAEIIPLIRERNPDAVILVGTPEFSTDLRAALEDPIAEYSNIAYSMHFYAGTHREEQRKLLREALEAGLPVIVSEFGASGINGEGPNDFTETDRWLALLDDYKVGRVCSCLCNAEQYSSLLKPECEKTSGWDESDLSEAGVWMVDRYQDTEESYREEMGTECLSLTSGEDSGVSAQISYGKTWTTDGENYSLYRIRIENVYGKAFDGWELTAVFDRQAEVAEGWNAEYTAEDNSVILTPVSRNHRLEPGSSAQFGIILKNGAIPYVRRLELRLNTEWEPSADEETVSANAEEAERRILEASESAARERAAREAEEKAKREAEEKAKREAEEKAKREAEEKAKREAEEKAKREAEEKAKREAEEKAKREAEEKAKREEEERAAAEAAEREAAERAAAEEAARAAEEQAAAEAAAREAEQQAAVEAAMAAAVVELLPEEDIFFESEEAVLW